MPKAVPIAALSEKSDDKRERTGSREVRKIDWRAEATWTTVCRRASGRRRYNAWRRFTADHRRVMILRRLDELGGLQHGVQAQLARELDVSAATISRDLAHLFRGYVQCPRCYSVVHRDEAGKAPLRRPPGVPLAFR